MRSEQTTLLNELINGHLEAMQSLEVDSEEYLQRVQFVERLNEVKSKTRSRRFSWDTVVTGAFSVLGILAIVAYEQKHVMTSKGMSLVTRPSPPK